MLAEDEGNALVVRDGFDRLRGQTEGKVVRREGIALTRRVGDHAPAADVSAASGLETFTQ